MDSNSTHWYDKSIINSKDCIILRNNIMKDTQIDLTTKGMYLYVLAITDNGDYPMPSMKYISKKTGICHDNVSKCLNNLIDNGYMRKNNMESYEIKEKNLKLKGKGVPCEWCGDKSIVLQEHHYPVPKSAGGTETVSICPNCHYGFHYLENQVGVVE